jgi:hypothetical protein
MCSVPEAEVTRHQGEEDTGHGWCITAEQVCWGTSVWVFRGSQMQGFFVTILKYPKPCDLQMEQLCLSCLLIWELQEQAMVVSTGSSSRYS